MSVALCALQAVNGAPQLRGPPQAGSYPWVALGDSYAAGPGAGQAYDQADPNECYRNQNAYPAQLHARFAAGQPANDLQYLACSGAVAAGQPTDKLVADQIKLMRPDAQLVTLSIGGNDVGFVDVLKSCVYFDRGDCAEAQRNATTKTEALTGSLRQTWDGIFDKLPAGDDSRKVYQTLYGQFFNAETTWCDTRRMDPLNPFRGPLIKQDMRRQVNQLTLALNDKIKTTMRECKVSSVSENDG